MSGIKEIRIPLSEEEHNELMGKKSFFGITWKELLIQGSDAMITLNEERTPVGSGV